MKGRGKLTLIFLVLLAIFSTPTWKLFLTGLPFVLAGLLVRIWALGHIVKDEELAVTGPYAMVRHPLYLGNFLIGLGFCTQAYPLSVLGFIPAFALVYIPTIRLEEDRLERKFKEEFSNWKMKTSVFLPSRIMEAIKTSNWSLQRFKRNSRHWDTLLILCFPILMCIKISFPFFACSKPISVNVISKSPDPFIDDVIRERLGEALADCGCKEFPIKVVVEKFDFKPRFFDEEGKPKAMRVYTKCKVEMLGELKIISSSRIINVSKPLDMEAALSMAREEIASEIAIKIAGSVCEMCKIKE